MAGITRREFMIGVAAFGFGTAAGVLEQEFYGKPKAEQNPPRQEFVITPDSPTGAVFTTASNLLLSKDAATFNYSGNGIRAGKEIFLALENNDYLMAVRKKMVSQKDTPIPTDLLDVIWVDKTTQIPNRIVFSKEPLFEGLLVSKDKFDKPVDIDYWNKGGAMDFLPINPTGTLTDNEISKLQAALDESRANPDLTQKSVDFTQRKWEVQPYGVEKDSEPTPSPTPPENPLILRK